MKMSLVLRMPRKMHLCKSFSNVPRLASLLEKLQDPRVLLICNSHAKPHLHVQKKPNPSIFCTINFEMCFTPQRHVLFRHPNFRDYIFKKTDIQINYPSFIKYITQTITYYFYLNISKKENKSPYSRRHFF